MHFKLLGMAWLFFICCFTESSDSESRTAKDEKKKDANLPVTDSSRKQRSSVDKIPVLGQGEGKSIENQCH